MVVVTDERSIGFKDVDVDVNELVTPELLTYAEGYAKAVTDVVALLDDRIMRGPVG